MAKCLKEDKDVCLGRIKLITEFLLKKNATKVFLTNV